jgi:hypothetical protein
VNGQWNKADQMIKRVLNDAPAWREMSINSVRVKIGRENFDEAAADCV